MVVVNVDRWGNPEITAGVVDRIPHPELRPLPWELKYFIRIPKVGMSQGSSVLLHWGEYDPMGTG